MWCRRAQRDLHRRGRRYRGDGRPGRCGAGRGGAQVRQLWRRAAAASRHTRQRPFRYRVARMTEAGQSGRSTRPGQPASVADMGGSESRGRQGVPRQVDNLRERASRQPPRPHQAVHLQQRRGHKGRGQGCDLGWPLRGPLQLGRRGPSPSSTPRPRPTIARPARWRLRHAATRQDADTGAGVAGGSSPVC